jgi:O-antigen/teichoic acid export membrane protein
MSESENSRRIAKNTLVLYIRMMVLMLIGLFTSRIVLNTLGVADYGTYNVVGGVVAMFAIVTLFFVVSYKSLLDNRNRSQ